jgi:hypothetical protein
MILPFMTHWPDGSETYFIDKIWNSIYGLHIYSEEEFAYQYNFYLNAYKEKFGVEWSVNQSNLNPKKHTIRLGNRWSAGDNIHMFIHSRSKNMFRFAPVIKCASTQIIEIKYQGLKQEGSIIPAIKIDGNYLDRTENLRLSHNDGFQSENYFFNFFNKDFYGQIVHWTNLKY